MTHELLHLARKVCTERTGSLQGAYNNDRCGQALV